MRITKTIFFNIIVCGIVSSLIFSSFNDAKAQDTLQHSITKDSIPPKKDSLKIIEDSIPSKNGAVTTAKDTGLLSHEKSNTLNLDSLRKIHSPRRAAFYSAVFPGLGQIYNHQYIKVPLMLGGMGVATGIFLFNFNKYITYRDAYRLRLNGHYTNDPQINLYSASDLQFLRDGYRQYVDYSVLGFAAVYLYNILDAIVFAHLYHFDVSNDLSKVRFGPVLNQYNPKAGYGFSYVGFGLSYQF